MYVSVRPNIRSCTEISLLFVITCFTSGKNCFSSIATNADVSLIHITRTWPQYEKASKIGLKKTFCET